MACIQCRRRNICRKRRGRKGETIFTKGEYLESWGRKGEYLEKLGEEEGQNFYKGRILGKVGGGRGNSWKSWGRKGAYLEKLFKKMQRFGTD